MDKEFLCELGISEEYADLIIEKNKADIDNIKINHAVENSLIKKGVKNIKAAMKLFDFDGLTTNENGVEGLEEKVNSFVSENDYLFENEKKPIFSAPPTPNSSPAITREEFAKMGYTKRLKLYNENPQAYMELSKN